MSSKFNLPIIALLLIGLISCEEQPVNCFDCPDTSRSNYFPLTEGSWWIYETQTTYGTEMYSSADTISADTIFVFQDTVYRVLTNNGFFMDIARKVDDFYYKRTLSCGFGPEYPFLKEITEQNVTLSLSGFYGSDLVLSEQRLPVFTVDGHEYSDVIRVNEKYGSSELITYYANNIGMIKLEHSGEGYSMTRTIKDFEVIQ